MGASVRTVCLCCLLLAVHVPASTASAADSSDTAQLLAEVNGVSASTNDGTKRQRSIIYRGDYAPAHRDAYEGNVYPFVMRAPFEASPAGRRHHPNDLHDQYEYNHPAKYAPEYKYQGYQQQYRAYERPPPPPYHAAPEYPPHGHPDSAREHGSLPDPFLAGHHRVNAQFEPDNAPPHAPPPHAARYPPPHQDLHLAPLPPVYRPAPPPPPHRAPVYHRPPPPPPQYIHRPQYTEEEHVEEPHEPLGSRRPKALGDLNPAPFIATIASAYEANENNFGVNRRGKLAGGAPEHAAFREHSLHARPAPIHGGRYELPPRHLEPVLRHPEPALRHLEPVLRHPEPGHARGAPYPELGHARGAPYPELVPLYALAAAGSQLSEDTVPPTAAAAGVSSEAGAEA